LNLGRVFHGEFSSPLDCVMQCIALIAATNSVNRVAMASYGQSVSLRLFDTISCRSYWSIALLQDWEDIKLHRTSSSTANGLPPLPLIPWQCLVVVPDLVGENIFQSSFTAIRLFQGSVSWKARIRTQ